MYKLVEEALDNAQVNGYYLTDLTLEEIANELMYVLDASSYNEILACVRRYHDLDVLDDMIAIEDRRWS